MTLRRFIMGLVLCLGIPMGTSTAQEVVTHEALDSPTTLRASKVYVIPIKGPIASPALYILRRGLKEAIANQADAVILDIDTPGGRLDITLEIIHILERFSGEILAYVNKEAISAGAYIAAASDAIYFTPNGVIGAAAVVSGTGEAIDETMRQKINSYLRAKIRSLSEAYPYRAQVIRAMMDLDYALTIEDQVLKEKGELLTLTATEAMRTYGEPPEPLLGAGIFESVTALLKANDANRAYRISNFEATWSEKLAQWFYPIAPIVLGVGMLCVFIEFKTPGFGIPGILGISLIAIFFMGQHVAGLAGHEPLLVFMLGVICLVVELFLLPGIFVFSILGALLVLGAILWAMVDVWPKTDYSPRFDPEQLINSLAKLGLALGIATGGFALLLRFLPKSWIVDKLILKTTIAAPDSVIAGGGSRFTPSLPPIGAKGLAVTDLHPTGEVEIENRRYQASVALGTVRHGTPVVVIAHRQFHLLVEKQ